MILTIRPRSFFQCLQVTLSDAPYNWDSTRTVILYNAELFKLSVLF